MSQNVGSAAYELLRKPPEKINVVDMQREMQKTVLTEINEIIASHKDYAPTYYIVYMLQKDRVLPNAIRQRFIVRRTKPAPTYDCSLFSYNNQADQLTFHWTIPDEETCQYLLANKATLSDEEKPLLSYVERFADGKLS